MPITYDAVREAARDLYGWSLKKVPDDTLLALAQAREQESNAASRKSLQDRAAERLPSILKQLERARSHPTENS